MANKNLTLKASVSLEVKKALSGLGKLQTGIANIGKSLATAFSVASIAMFGKQVINIGKDFEDAMARVKAVSNATVGEFNTLTAAARKMGETTKYTATEAAEALEKLTRNGMKATEAALALPSVLKFAQANAIELAQAADILKISLNMFDLSATNSARVADVLSTTAANTATNVLELHDALVNVAPAAKVLGFGIEEVASAIGALAQRGVKGAAAGTQLRIGLIKMVDPKIIKKMQALGIDIDENTMKAEGLYNTLKKFSDQNVSLEQLTEIFSQKGAVGVQQLVNGLEDMQYMMAQIANQAGEGGTTARMFRDGIGSMKRELDTLKSKWESTMIAWSTGTKSPITSAVRFLQNMADMLRNSFGSAIIALSNIWLPLLVKGIVNLVSKLKILKTAITDLSLVSWKNIWVALAQAVALVVSSVVGGIQKMNRPIKEATDALDGLDVEAGKTKTQMDKLADSMSHLSKDNSEDFNAFVSLLDKLKALFPDLADAIDDAGKRAFNSGNWKEFKETLEDIYSLQNKITKQGAYKDLYEAQINKMRMTGLIGPSMSQNPAHFGNSYAGPSRDWTGAAFLDKIESAMKNGFGKIQIEDFQNKLIKAIIENTEENAEAKIKQYLENYSIGDLFSDELIKNFAKAVKNSDMFKATSQIWSNIAKMPLDILWDKYNIASKNFDENLKTLDRKTDSNKVYNLAAKYKRELESLYNEAIGEGLYDFAKGMKEGINNIQREFIDPLKHTSSTWRNTESPLGKKMADYVDSEKALWAQKENGVLTNEEYNKKLRELRAETFETIAKFDDLDGQLALLGEDAIKLKNTLLLAWTELKAITEGEEVASSEEKTKSDLKSFRSKYPQFKERDKSRDWRLTDKQIAEEDLRHLENYHDALVSFLASIDEEELKEKGIFDEVKQEIEDLKAKLEWAKKNIDDKDILIDYIEQLEKVDDIIKDIEAHTMSIKDLTMQSIRNYGKQIEQVGSHTLSIAQNIDKLRELNGLEPIFNDESIQKLQAYANILKDLVGIYDAIKKAMEVTAAIDDYRSAQKFKNTLQNIAATQAETAAEKAQAAEAMKVAVAEGAGSVAKTPWIGPALAVAAAAMISAAIISNSKKFAKGGLIDYGTSSGDNTLARVNRGEMIINKGQQANLFKMLNQGSTGGGEVQFRIQGKDLVGVLRNEKLLTTGRL